MPKSRFDKNKKTVYFIIMLIVLIVGAYTVFIIPAAVKHTIPKAATVFPENTIYIPTVSCNGNLEYSSLSSVSCTVPVVIGEYLVHEGERVDAGQVIATVDKNATIAAVTALYGEAAVSVMAQETVSELEKGITSEVSGVVFSLAEKGSLISADSAVAKIGSKGDLVLKAAVSERYIAKVGCGQKVTVKVTAVDGKHRGTVKEISSVARKVYNGSVQETVVDVVISLDEASAELKSGFSADGKIETGIARQILTLPYSAIQQDDKGEFVYVFKNGTAVRKDITTGLELSQGAEVNGIEAYDEIILADDGIRNNSPVIRG